MVFLKVLYWDLSFLAIILMILVLVFLAHQDGLLITPVYSNLPSVSMSKYLGLIFDNFLSFEPHINNLARKLSKTVGILSKVLNFCI